MSKRNENRLGYKNTKVGWIPIEWGIQTIGELCSFSSGHGFRKHDWSSEGLPIIRIQNLNDSKDFNYFAGETDPKWVVFPGELFFAWAGVKGVSFGPTIWRGPKGVLNQHIYKIHTKREVDRRWFFLALLQVTEIVEKKAHGFKSSLLHIHKGDITKQEIPIPPFNGQKKIAEILSTWGRVIEQLRKLINAIRRLKKALMQQLLTSKTKLRGFEEDSWEIESLGNLISPISRPVPKPDRTYLSIGLRSHCKGTFHKFIDESEKILMDTLYRVEPEDLIVNITFAWEGAIAFVTEEDSGGLVSHRFPTFRLKTKNAVIEFVRNLILTKRFIWDLGLILPGGAGRNRVMNKKDFLKLKVYVPSIQNQIKIGQVLSTADSEINQLEKKLKAMEKQKRGLCRNC